MDVLKLNETNKYMFANKIVEITLTKSPKS